MSTSPKIRPRENEEDHSVERAAKRTKVDENANRDVEIDTGEVTTDAVEQTSSSENKEHESMLPPSHALLGAPAPVYTADGSMQRIMETDVGISEYIGHDVPRIEGIIKQRFEMLFTCCSWAHAKLNHRFTDFLVFEVDLDSNVIHLKSLEKPESSPKKDAKQGGDSLAEAASIPAVPTNENSAAASETTPTQLEEVAVPQGDTVIDLPLVAAERGGDDEIKVPETQNEVGPWPERFTATLAPFLSEETIGRLKDLFLEGPEPPFVSDSGWGGRQAKVGESEEAESSSAVAEMPQEEPSKREKGKRGRDRGSRGGRGGRGGRVARGGRPGGREDHRKVLTDVCFAVFTTSWSECNLTLASSDSESRPKPLVLAFIKPSETYLVGR